MKIKELSMKIKKSINGFGTLLLLLIGIMAISAISASAQNDKDVKQNAKLAKQAKITPEQARATAQAKEPNGTIESSELEKENGKLVYSFDIRNEKGTITEVQVDAKTGKVVSVEEEDKQAEEKEKQEDAKKAKKKS